MSDHEFNNYLTLLAGLLRLGDKQRRAIAEELRTHLEDRLEELLARGVPREEAVQRALAEFGDAAGLASQFASISRGRRRRWLMRVTTFSVAATVLLAAGIATFWPGRNAGPGPAAAVAHAPGGVVGPGQGVPGAAKAAPAPADRLLEAKLNRRINIEFVETPLKDALQFLQDQNAVAFYLKGKKLEDAGVSLDQAITCNLQQVRLSTFLDLKLEELGLVYYEKDDLLVITTPDDAESTLEIRVYDCRDLLAMPEPSGEARRGGSLPGARPLPAAARSAPGGSFPSPTPAGPAAATPPPGVGAPGPGPGPAVPPPSRSDPFAVPPGAPRAPAPPVDPFGDPPPSTPRPAGRDPFAPPGATPPAAAPAPPAVLPQFARPDDVLAQGGFGGIGGEAPPKPLSEHEQRAQRLIDLISTSVNPQSWTEMGGSGSISEYHGLIVVTQTAQTHKKVEHVLNMLRQAADLEAPQGRVVR